MSSMSMSAMQATYINVSNAKLQSSQDSRTSSVTVILITRKDNKTALYTVYGYEYQQCMKISHKISTTCLDKTKCYVHHKWK